MPDTSLRQKVDNFLTNYLRNTTTDQEILDYYGEGNIVGRKGIPSNDKELLDIVEASSELNNSPLRPNTGREDFAVGGIDQGIKYNYKTNDIPGVVNPATGRPWQMTFGVLPKDFGSSSLTPAAKQFLVDFRVPVNAGNDYSFATGPNVLDRIETETKDLKQNDPYYGKQPERLQEKIKDIESQSDYIGHFGGQPQTPRTWQERGYITEKPTGLKENVLNEFKNKIFETQGAFGGVSTLTPVEQGSALNPNWRADLYERKKLAGPLSGQPFSSGYGHGSKNVQRFVTGKETTLPLQPYAEFFQRLDSTPPSVLKTVPARDFTPFQKTIGTRNYLIGQNILAGRGSLGVPGRGIVNASKIGITDFIPSREVVSNLYNNQPLEAVKNYATEFIGGVPQALAVGSAVAAAPALAPVATVLGGSMAITKTGNAIDEAYRQTTGKSWRERNQPVSPYSTYTGPTPAIQPRMGTAILGGKPVQVPYGSVAGERKVGRPWWDTAGSRFQELLNEFNPIIGR
jgi:hypothetical protein